MKHIVFGVCVVVLVFSFAAQAEVPGQPGPEYKKLEVWVGNWTIQGEAKDNLSGPTYKVNWTMKGEWLPGGYFLLINGSAQYPDREVRWLEILSYDPVKKTHMGHVFWLQGGGADTYTMTFKDRTILSGGQGWRQEWKFSPDGMSLTGKREREQDGKWWTTFDVKGVKK
jgi:hypothetical protein